MGRFSFALCSCQEQDRLLAISGKGSILQAPLSMLVNLYTIHLTSHTVNTAPHSQVVFCELDNL